MTHQIIFHPLADREFREAFNWYQEKLEGLGNRFEKKVEEALNLIAKTPYYFQRRRRTTGSQSKYISLLDHL